MDLCGPYRGKNKRPTVLLLNPPAPQPVLRDNYCGFMSKASYLWPPIDLLVQSGWLSGNFNVSVLDAIAEGLSVEPSLERVLAGRPEVLFLLSSGATFQDDAAFASLVRQGLPDTPIVVSMSDKVMVGADYLERFPWVDGVLNDYSSPAVRDALMGRPHDAALVTRQQPKPTEGGEERVLPLSYPMPRHTLFPLKRYCLPLGWSGTFTTVLTGFGCAHSCSFCSGSAIRYRRRRREEVLAELEMLRSLGIKNLFFIDYTFTSSNRYVLELCREMVARQFNFRWTCFGRVDQLTDEVVAVMKAAGCDLIQLGVESGDDSILRRYHKGFTVAQVRSAFARCKRHQLRTLAFFIVGLPGETRESVKRTIQLAIELDPDLASFAMPTPDPGTALKEEAQRRGILGQEPEQVISTVGPTVGSEALSIGEIRGLHREAVRRFYLRPSFLLGQLRSLRSLGDVKEKAQNAIQLFMRSQ